MSMGDTSSLMWSMVFGAIGLGFLTYGRKQRAVVPLVTGIALCVFPYFIADTTLQVAVGVALVGLPFLLRRFA